MSARRAPLRRALALLAVVAAVLAAVEAVLAAGTGADDALLYASYPVAGAGFVLIGGAAWSRRPSNHTGALLCVTGGLILGAALADDGLPPVLNAVGVLLGELPIAATLHVVLAFPSGRLPTPLDRALVQLLYAVVLLRQLPAALPGPDLEPLRLGCSIAGATVIVVGVVRLVLRVRAERRGTSERRVLVAVYGYGGALLLFFPFSARVLLPLLDLQLRTVVAVQIAGLAVLPAVFAAGVLFGGFGRTGELDELASWLGTQAPDETSLREALAEVLGDPTLDVLHTRPGSRAAVVAAGARGAVPVPGADGTDIGVTLSYDRTLFADPAPVLQAGRVVAVALERERLRADLLLEREALRASRARVVEVGDGQRRKLAQDLHDLLQSRLTLAVMQVGRLAIGSTDPGTRAQLHGLRGELDVLVTEVRSIVHGVMPALLLERGLPAAVEDLVDRVPLRARLELRGADRLAPVVASHAYFILAEAITNAVRHAQAQELVVVVTQDGDVLRLVVRDDGVGGARHHGGAGLRGIVDRVEALDGSVTVSSPVGGGTTIEAVLPCAW